MRTALSTLLPLSLLVASRPPRNHRTPKPAVPLFEGLGKHTPAGRDAKPDAQKYFDQGLAFLFAFNHDEAIRSFRHAAALDPDCAMAHWGVALASGPHIQQPALPAGAGEGGVGRPRSRPARRRSGESPADRALIEALGQPVRRPAAGGPQAARRGVLRGDAGGVGEVPGGRRRRRPVRRVADEPAAVGPVDGRRQAAAGDAGDPRHPGGGAEARPGPPAGPAPVHPRRRGVARTRARPTRPPTGSADLQPAWGTWSTCRRTSTSAAAGGRRRSRRTSGRSRPTGRTRRPSPSRGSTGCTWPTTTTCWRSPP